MCMYACLCMCVYMYIHGHIHIYIYVCTLTLIKNRRCAVRISVKSVELVGPLRTER